jgi:hypothetical protein
MCAVRRVHFARGDTGEDLGPMYPLRLGMKTPSARRQAVLRAVGEENRALSAAAEARSHGGQRSRIRPTPASGWLLRGGRLGAVVLVVSLVAGLIVFNPAVTDLSAGWVETPPVARQHDHGGFSARRVSVIAPDRLADPGSTAVFPFDAFPPLTVLQESLALSEYGPGYGPMGTLRPTQVLDARSMRRQGRACRRLPPPCRSRACSD